MNFTTLKAIFIILFIIFFFKSFNIYSDTNSPIILKLNIDSAVLIGKTNSILLNTIQAKKETFKMLLTEKWRNYLPRVGINYFGLKNLNYNQIDSAYNDVRVTINQLLYDGGENSREIEIAKLQGQLNAEDFNITQEKLSFEIRKSYLETLLAASKLYLAQSSYKKIYSQYSDIISQQKSGFAIDLQKIELNSKFRELELAEEKAKGQLRLSLFTLKQILSLDPNVELILEENPLDDFIVFTPKIDVDKYAFFASQNKEEIKKSKLAIEISKSQKEKSENYWKPKISVGAYAGQNVNGLLPVKNEIYGFNFNVSTQFGSNTARTSGNYGVQTSGSGIQRIEGFGNQPVGQGDNAFNSADIRFWDELSYSRKIIENQIQIQELVGKHKATESEIRTEVYKVYDKLNEYFYNIRISNSKVYLQYESLRLLKEKYNKGFSKRTELIGIELDFLKSQDELAEAFINYIIHSYKFSYVTSINISEFNLFQIKKGKGNSLLKSILNNKIELRNNDLFDNVPLKKEKGLSTKDIQPKKENRNSQTNKNTKKEMEYFYEN